MSRGHYPSDLTDGQWQVIKKLLPPIGRRGRPPIDRREIVNAILYVVYSGCQWRMLPHDLPKWKTVYTVFWRWRKLGIWQRIHDALRERVRLASGKKRQPTAAIVDSQSARTAEGGTERGFDAGKKVNGRKRHIAVDTLGLLLAVVVHQADLQDHDGAVFVFHKLASMFARIKVIFADGAYIRNGLPTWTQRRFGWILQTILRPVTVRGFQVLPKRWIVERTFAWLGRCRRHSKDYERNPETSEAFIMISMIRLMTRRLAV